MWAPEWFRRMTTGISKWESINLFNYLDILVDDNNELKVEYRNKFNCEHCNEYRGRVFQWRSGGGIWVLGCPRCRKIYRWI